MLAMLSSKWSKRTVKFCTIRRLNTVGLHDCNSRVGLALTRCPDKWDHPRIISMGGDHSIVLPILRSLKTVYGPVSVIHLDSHLDTWDPYEGYTGIVSNQSAITHGTFFWHASREGCIRKGTSVHGGLRTKLFVSPP
jgi:arginase family enzyme